MEKTYFTPADYKVIAREIINAFYGFNTLVDSNIDSMGIDVSSYEDNQKRVTIFGSDGWMVSLLTRERFDNSDLENYDLVDTFNMGKLDATLKALNSSYLGYFMLHEALIVFEFEDKEESAEYLEDYEEKYINHKDIHSFSLSHDFYSEIAKGMVDYAYTLKEGKKPEYILVETIETLDTEDGCTLKMDLIYEIGSSEGHANSEYPGEDYGMLDENYSYDDYIDAALDNFDFECLKSHIKDYEMDVYGADTLQECDMKSDLICSFGLYIPTKDEIEEKFIDYMTKNYIENNTKGGELPTRLYKKVTQVVVDRLYGELEDKHNLKLNHNNCKYTITYDIIGDLRDGNNDHIPSIYNHWFWDIAEDAECYGIAQNVIEDAVVDVVIDHFNLGTLSSCIKTYAEETYDDETFIGCSMDDDFNLVISFGE